MVFTSKDLLFCAQNRPIRVSGRFYSLLPSQPFTTDIQCFQVKKIIILFRLNKIPFFPKNLYLLNIDVIFPMTCLFDLTLKRCTALGLNYEQWRIFKKKSNEKLTLIIFGNLLIFQTSKIPYNQRI